MIEERDRKAREAEEERLKVEKMIEAKNRPKEKKFVPKHFTSGMADCTRAHLKERQAKRSLTMRYEYLWQKQMKQMTYFHKIKTLKEQYLLEKERATSAVRLKPMIRKGVSEAQARSDMISKSLKGDWTGNLPLCRVAQREKKARAEKKALLEREEKEAERHKNTSANIYEVIQLVKKSDKKNDSEKNTSRDDHANKSMYSNPLRRRWERYLQIQDKMNTIWKEREEEKRASEAAKKAEEDRRRRILGLCDSDEEGEEL